MPSIGDVVEVVVEQQRPFGVFVNMNGERNALIEIVHLFDKPVRVTPDKMPQVGTKLTAIVLGRRKSGQYELSVRRSHFEWVGKGDRWRAWDDRGTGNGSGG